MTELSVEVLSATVLRFDDGTPVRAASAVAPFEGGWLVAQDDATSAAWWVDDAVRRLRVLPRSEGHDVFSSSDGTKHLKPDLEVACRVPGGVLLLGSGSTPARMRGVLVRSSSEPAEVADLTPLYGAVTAALGLDPGLLNLEGACVVGTSLRWFQRGAATLPSTSIDVDISALLGAFGGTCDVPLGDVRRYDLGRQRGVALAVTDAAALADGRVLVSAAAEDTPNPYDDGPVVASALALLDDSGVTAMCALPEVGGRVLKVEGLAVRSTHATGVDLLAVVDADDPQEPSVALVLRVTV